MNDQPAKTPNASRPQHWTLIGPLLAVHVLLGTVAVWATDAGGPFVQIVAASLVISQGGLLGIWAALGGRPAPWRLLAVLAVLIGCMWLSDVIFPHAFFPQVSTWVYLLSAVTAGLALLVLRAWGITIVKPGRGDLAAETHRFQFSLRSLLEWTAGMAAFLAAFQMTTEGFLGWICSSVQRTVAILMFYGTVGLLAGAALGVALGTRFAPARILALGATGAAVVAAVMHIPGPLPLGEAIVFGALCVVWLAGTLWLFRLAGYRLLWRGAVRL